MIRRLGHLIAWGVLILSGAGCTSAPAPENTRTQNPPSSYTPTYRETPPPPVREPDPPADITSTYIQNGVDTRVSPKGKTRSTVPDRIIVCEVEYTNSNTGRTTTYTLPVDFEDGRPRRLNWPNGGWMGIDSPTRTADGWEFTQGNQRYSILSP